MAAPTPAQRPQRDRVRQVAALNRRRAAIETALLNANAAQRDHLALDHARVLRALDAIAHGREPARPVRGRSRCSPRVRPRLQRRIFVPSSAR
jgi:hypothetical protein